MDPLEYAEEEDDGDLFGDEDDVRGLNDAVPIAANHHDLITPSVQASSSTGPSRPSIAVKSVLATTQSRTEGLPPSADEHVRSRVVELRLKKGAMEKLPRIGPSTLKALTLGVVKANAGRIWDVGDVSYSLLKPFIDELDSTQLDEIEQASPHLKKDTDWLWELYMLTDYPLFHERCRERKGEQRTSGWRRMYAKAIEDDEERRQQAVQKMADRYEQLDAERASKRVVMVDQVIPTRKARGGKRSVSGSRPGGAAAHAPPVSALSKMRQQSQQARLALTHASGRFAAPNSSRIPINSIARVAKAPPDQGQRHVQPAPPPMSARIPPPRSTAKPAKSAPPSAPRPGAADDYLPGSFPTSSYPEMQKALPEHLKAPLSTPSSSGSDERFSIPAIKPKQYQQLHRPVVQNFEAPTASSINKKGRGVGIDFFGDSAAPSAQVARQGVDISQTGPALPLATAVNKIPPPVKRPMTPEMERNKLESLMFRKKKPKVGAR